MSYERMIPVRDTRYGLSNALLLPLIFVLGICFAAESASAQLRAEENVGVDFVSTLLLPAWHASDLSGPLVGVLLRAGSRPFTQKVIELGLRTGFLFGLGKEWETPDSKLTTRLIVFPMWISARFFIGPTWGPYISTEAGINVLIGRAALIDSESVRAVTPKLRLSPASTRV